MKIDHLMIESLIAWGRTWTQGRPVRLEFEIDITGRTLCLIFDRDPHPDRVRYPLSTLHPVAHTLVGEL